MTGGSLEGGVTHPYDTGNKNYGMINAHAHIVKAHMVIGSLPQVRAQQPSVIRQSVSLGR